MLPKQHRLKKQKDFEKIFEQGRGARQEEIIIRFLPNQKEFSRFGFIVSKKVSKKAVIRNRIKRLLREAIRYILPDLKQGFDVVVIALSGIEKKNFHQIKEMLFNIFNKVDLIKKK